MKPHQQRDAGAPDAIHRHIKSGLFNSDFRVAGRRSDAALSACRAMRCGSVDVMLCEGGGPRYTRRALRHIRADQADDILVVAPLKAKVLVSQRGVTEQVLPDGFTCLSTRQPLSSITSALDPREWFSLYLVRIPAPLLRAAIPHIDEACGRVVSAGVGAGRIMLGMFRDALAEGQALTAEQSRRLGTMLVDATINAASGATELAGTLAHDHATAAQRVHAKAIDYIHAHLSDAALGAEAIAAHCGTSRRYVDQVFAMQGETIGKVIRELRLQACRDALAVPRLSHRSVAEIAFRWGFNDPAHFSRVFKARFGYPPRMQRDKHA